MTDSTITDGTTTVTFGGAAGNGGGLISIDYEFVTDNLFTQAYPNGQGDICMDYGYKRRQFTIEYYFKSDGTYSAADYVEHLESLWITKNATYKYQRKITLVKPDGKTRIIQGKIQSIVSHQTYGENFNYNEGKIVIFEDIVSTPIP